MLTEYEFFSTLANQMLNIVTKKCLLVFLTRFNYNRITQGNQQNLLREHHLDELPQLWNVFRGDMAFVGPRPDVPGYADKLEGGERDVLKLRPGITGPATLKYRLEDEMISEYVAKKQAEGDSRSIQEIATEYNDTVIYPDKVRLNCYYYHHYSFIKDIEMIFATVLGFKVKFAGEEV